MLFVVYDSKPVLIILGKRADANEGFEIGLDFKTCSVQTDPGAKRNFRRKKAKILKDILAKADSSVLGEQHHIDDLHLKNFDEGYISHNCVPVAMGKTRVLSLAHAASILRDDL